MRRAGHNKLMELQYTGERFVPWVDDFQTYYEHLHRYMFAMHLAKGQRVLDLACGEGYGSCMLADLASYVVGVDISQDAVAHAASTYMRSNLQFIRATMSNVPIKSNSFDLVTCFEAIEHVDENEQEKVLAEVKRLMRPGGIFLVSTPDRIEYSQKTGYRNPFHKRELTFEEFQGLLMGRFKSVKFFGQRVYPVSNIWSLENAGDGREDVGSYNEFVVERAEDGLSFFRMSRKTPLYLLAVASDGDVPSDVRRFQVSMLLDSSQRVFQKVRWLEARVRELEAESEVQIDELNARIASLVTRLAAAQQDLVVVRESEAWKIGLFLSRIGAWVFPRGSRRRKILRLGARAFHVIRRSGNFYGRIFGPSGSRVRSIWGYRRHLHPTASSRESAKSDVSVSTTRSAVGDQPLLREKMREIRDSGLFDEKWYLTQNPDVRNSYVDPLEHYVWRGASEGRDPNPLFNTSIYVAAHMNKVPPEDALIHFSRSGQDFAPGAYRTADILVAIQHRYRSSTEMRCIRDGRQSLRRHAVYLQCGSGSQHAQWLGGGARDWDLIVNHYDPAFVGRIPCEVEFEQVGALPGTKFTSFFTLLTRWPDMVDEYEYVLLLDDDVAIAESDIDVLFGTAEEYALDLAQASVTADSYCAHPVCKCRGASQPRYVSAVEIMMPLLSRRCLRVGGHVFGQTVSGWGLDMVLGKLVREQLGGKAAIVDRVVAVHARPINPEQGSFYKMLRRAHIYAEIELTHLQRLYGTGREIIEI